jgi:AAA15 family ATPase/GTPase
VAEIRLYGKLDMLLRFGVTNYLSLRDTQEFSLIATSLKGVTDGLLSSDGLGEFRGVPSAVIYGANASGKSNVIRALEFMRRAILRSHSSGDPAGGVPRQPFALSKNHVGETSSLDADFIVDGVRYHYGFEADDESFTSEWLYSFPEGKRRKLFERKGREVDFGPSFRGAKKILVDLMRPNSLFLSTATQNDHEFLSGIVKFFRSISISKTVHANEHEVNLQLREVNIDPRAIFFLNRIGTGVTNFRRNESELPEQVIKFSNSLAKLGEEFLAETSNFKFQMQRHTRDVSIELSHLNDEGEESFLPMERESSGTRRLLILLQKVFKALDNGSVLLVDEIDASLHTRATEAIIELFNDKNFNRLGAQIIATTHDTNLMLSTSLRRDQIWFVEKDSRGASFLFPLSDIKSRQNDNFEAGYLQGRYGAIPFSGSVQTLMEAKEADA